MINLPRVLNSNLAEKKRINPVSLQISENLTPLSTATMTVRKKDAIAGRTFVRLYTPNGKSEIYRTRVPEIRHGDDYATIQLDHAVCEVGDYMVQDAIKAEKTVREAFDTVFAHYRGTLWTLGSFTATETVTIDCDYDNVLEVLLSILDQVPQYMMKFNFSTTPWSISLATKPTEIGAEGRLSRNIRSAVVKRDDKDLCTRVYVKGLPKPEGRESDENAIGYIDADTIETYGIVEKETGGTNLTAEQATRIANAYLDAHKNPKLSVEIDMDDLSEITDEDLDAIVLGKKFRLAVPDENVVIEDYITRISWSDVYNNPYHANVVIGDLQDAAINFLQDQASSSKNSKKNAKKQAKTDEVFEKNFQKTDEYGAILEQAGMKLDEHGMIVYARDNVNNLGAIIDMTASELRSEYQAGDLGLTSVIDQTASAIYLAVDNTKSDLHSSLEVTANGIRADVSAASSSLYSVIEQTATSIRSEVADTISDVRSSIQQTADSIRADVSTANSSIYSVIEQTASSIRTEVANTDSDIRSSIEQTANGIRADVSSASSSIYTVIEQTASAIRTEVANTESDIRSSITQTADSIRADVSSANSSIYTVIEQTATSIRSEVHGKARVYVQIADPAVEGLPVTEGDIWIKSLKVQSWNDFASHTWQDASSFDWKQYAGAPQFIWDGERWEPIGDQGAMSEYETEINQTNRKIELIARAVNAIDPDAINLASLEITADAITAAVSTAKSEMYSVVRQTATNIVSTVANTISDIRATVEQTAASITTSVSAAKSDLYTTIMVTLSGVVQTVSGEITESVILQTSTSIYQAVSKKNRVFIQLTDPASNNTVINGDIWIKAVGDNKLKPTWSELSVSTWTSQNNINWREYYEGYWYVRKGNVWSRMNANADVVEIGTFLEQDERKIALIARDVDANHQELGSRLEVTAQYIRSEVHAAKSNLYSVVMQTATNVFSGVYNEVGNNFSTIEQTASSITLAVTAAKSDLCSVIMQTATGVFSGVYDKVGNNFSTITQTASGIEIAVASAKSALYSSIVATSTSIISTVGEQYTTLEGRVGTVESTITQTSSKIALVVTNKDGNDVVDAASIVAGINAQTGSYVKIAAKTINLSGYVTADSLTADWLSSKIAEISSLSVMSESITGSLRVGGTIYFGTDPTDVSKNLNTSIKELQIVSSGNTYKLQKKSFNDKSWQDVGSFSRATSLSGSWSGRTHKVTASPQGNEMNTVISVYIPIPQGQASASTNAYVATGKSTAPYYETHGDAYPLCLVKSGLTVNLRNVNSSSGGVTYASTTCSDSNLKAANIKKDVSIFGVTGTYAGTTPQASNIQLYKDGVGDITRSTTAPTGNPLTSLATILKQAYQNLGGAGHYVKFPATINGGTGTKWFYIDMTP